MSVSAENLDLKLIKAIAAADEDRKFRALAVLNGGNSEALEPLLTLQGVATNYGVHVTTLLRWGIHAISMCSPGGRKYRLSQVEKWLKTVASVPPARRAKLGKEDPVTQERRFTGPARGGTDEDRKTTGKGDHMTTGRQWDNVVMHRVRGLEGVGVDRRRKR